MAVFLLLGPTLYAQASEKKATEVQVKAAYVYNFAKFVEWPYSGARNDDSLLRIAVVGQGKFADAMRETAKGKRVSGRMISVVESADSATLAGCHVVYFLKQSADAVQHVLSGLQDHPILTVGEQDDFIKSGGMIRLFLKNDRVQFEIAPNRVRQQDLEISAKLLKLALIANETKEDK